MDTIGIDVNMPLIYQSFDIYVDKKILAIHTNIYYRNYE